MNSVQPLMAVAAVVAGVAAGGIGASLWWWPRVKRARRLIDRIEASRQLMNQQSSQARRQIEHLQLELGELRLIAERFRRKAMTTGSPAETLDGPESILPAEPPPASRRPASSAGESDAGFAQTQYEDPDDAARHGFAPTQIEKRF
ncbi:hypothetical protein [Roseateles sp.]|uniref:hypothetical protein n=1 Tax=Roseateles sp. TaxID=1971397 RepID=UPI0031D7A18C